MDNRARLWGMLIWCDCKVDYKEVLDNNCVPWCESPWHDSDVNADGTLKKSHKHIILAFSGKKSFEQVKAITDSLGTSIPQKINDLRASVRYFIHADDKTKHQYNLADIQTHCGFTDISKFFELTKQEKIDTVADIMRFIENNRITEFTDLESYCRECRFNDWYPVFFDGGIKYLFDMKIRSFRNVLKNT